MAPWGIVTAAAAALAGGASAFLLVPWGIEGAGRRALMRRRGRAGSVGTALLQRLPGVAQARERRRLAGLRSGLPAALAALSASVGAGQSSRQAFAYVAANLAGPLGDEFLQVVWDLDAGRNMDEALERLEERVPLPEMRLVCTAFALQQRTGGSLQRILASASRSVTESMGFQRSLEVQTAQSRLSARIVAIMPFVIMALVGLVSPGYVIALLTPGPGLMLLVVACGLDALGVVAIRRIVRVRP